MSVRVEKYDIVEYYPSEGDYSSIRVIILNGDLENFIRQINGIEELPYFGCWTEESDKYVKELRLKVKLGNFVK